MATSGIFNMEAYQELEKKYADFVGSEYAVSCNSGTAALHLSLLALGVGPGDEVIVPDFTMAACAFAVSYTGARPVFADVSLLNYAVTADEIEKRITKKTKAIMVVHVYGRLAPMDDILRVARAYKLPVIEDACEAQGAVFKSKADLTVYSFYGNKIIPAQEGGMITTNNRKLAKYAAYLKNMAFSPAHDYMHRHIGYNYRMPNAQADIALRSLDDYPLHKIMRREIEAEYSKKLPMPQRDAVWFYEVPVKNKAAILKKIPEARNCFKPLSSFPMYGGGKGRKNALALSKQLILLPVRTDMSLSRVREICDMI